jgi:hypothetical protein
VPFRGGPGNQCGADFRRCSARAQEGCHGEKNDATGFMMQAVGPSGCGHIARLSWGPGCATNDEGEIQGAGFHGFRWGRVVVAGLGVGWADGALLAGLSGPSGLSTAARTMLTGISRTRPRSLSAGTPPPAGGNGDQGGDQ